MKKIAIFVEGWTEFIFVARLLEEMQGFGKVHLELKTQHGGLFHDYRSQGVPDEFAEFWVLLVNCCCDGKVKPAILERRDLLINSGYELVIGLQDLHPKPFVDWQRVEDGLNSGLADHALKVRISLEVMEAEAWFLNESTHFEKLDPSLTIQRIAESTGFNPASDIAESGVPLPAKMLERIYRLAELRYDKKQAEIHRTVAALDFSEIYLTVRSMSKSLDRFFSHLEEAGLC